MLFFYFILVHIFVNIVLTCCVAVCHVIYLSIHLSSILILRATLSKEETINFILALLLGMSLSFKCCDWLIKKEKQTHSKWQWVQYAQGKSILFGAY